MRWILSHAFRYHRSCSSKQCFANLVNTHSKQLCSTARNTEDRTLQKNNQDSGLFTSQHTESTVCMDESTSVHHFCPQLVGLTSGNHGKFFSFGGHKKELESLWGLARWNIHDGERDNKCCDDGTPCRQRRILSPPSS